MSLIEELKRRNVFRVGAAYLALGWVVTQVTGTIAPAMHLPDWTIMFVVWIGAIAFPFVMVFAWVYELTPEGLKREREIDKTNSITHVTGRRLDYITIGIVALGVALFAFQEFRPRRAEPASVATSPAAAMPATTIPTATVPAVPVAAPADKTIAVLPFVDMSAGKDQEYMSDGIAEELLNLLAKIPELQVTSRSSAFSYKGKEFKLAQVASELHVAHVLEGSVRKSGNKVRITAQLIDARTDTHLWSETYDRSLDDIFAVQDEIAAAVVAQLKIKLLGAAPKAKEVDPTAFALYLQARQLSRQITAAAYEQSNAFYQQALAIYPGYAGAWNGLAINYMNQAADGLRPADEAYQLAREAVDKALAIDPDSAAAHGVLGAIAMGYDGDLAAAARQHEKSLALEPGNLSAQVNAANLTQGLGRFDQAIALNQIIIAHDPVNPVIHGNQAGNYLYAGRYDDAIASFRTALALSPGFGGAQLNIGIALLLKGEPEAALSAIQQEASEPLRLCGLALASHALGKTKESDAALAEVIRKYPNDMAYLIADVMGFRGEIDHAFDWLAKAVARHDPNLVPLPFDPLLVKLHADPRWLPLLHKLGKAPEQLAAIKFEVSLPQ